MKSVPRAFTLGLKGQFFFNNILIYDFLAPPPILAQRVKRNALTWGTQFATLEDNGINLTTEPFR